jgi:hypothetical protein
MSMAGFVRRARACAKLREMRPFIYGRSGNISLAALEVFFIVGGGFPSFFGSFPSVPIATPKIPGVVIIKGPLTAHKK